jgi:phosphate transport system substrate-binding protein
VFFHHRENYIPFTEHYLYLLLNIYQSNPVIQVRIFRLKIFYQLLMELLVSTLLSPYNLDVKLYRLFLFLVIIILLAGCSGRGSSAENTSEQIKIIENKGSDTIVNLALAWAEEYQVVNPSVDISVTGGGSGTGIAALINGTVDIANASRKIKLVERETALENGSDPVEFVIARDAIAIIVHLDNPVDHLTLQQISAIYSGAIDNWKEVGGEDRPIVRLSRETNSGTHVYFLDEVIRLGEDDNKTLFSQNTLLLPSSEGIGAEIRQNPNAIGYDGLGYVTDEMKVIGVASSADDPFILPSAGTVNSDQYPIARDLYMYTNGEPEGFIKEYLDWILSTDAQKIVTELGFVPITK